MPNDICIFCKIVHHEIPCRLIWSDDNFMAFYDINPKAPIHFLVIPKHHIEQFSALKDSDRAWLADFMLAIKKAADILNLEHYKIVFNNGSGSGQEVFHLHAHVLQY